MATHQVVASICAPSAQRSVLWWVLSPVARGARKAALALDAPLANRRRYSVAEYESIREGDRAADVRPAGPHGARPGEVAFAGVESDRRVYVG